MNLAPPVIPSKCQYVVVCADGHGGPLQPSWFVFHPTPLCRIHDPPHPGTFLDTSEPFFHGILH